MKRIDSVVWLPLLLLAGCFPYDAHFLCEKTNDYGRCTSVQGAYGDAIRGGDEAPAAGEEASTPQPAAGADGDGKAPAITAHDRYKDSEYRTMAELIDAPVAPVVTPPKVLRTLVVAYASDKALYLPRYVFYIADESRFVLGDYLNSTVINGPTIYPNGADAASSP